MPAAKAQVTLRGLRIADCNAMPESEGLVVPWVDVRFRSHKGGAVTIGTHTDRQGFAHEYRTALGLYRTWLARRLRARAYRLAGENGSLSLAYDAESNPNRLNTIASMLIITFTLVVGGIAHYVEEGDPYIAVAAVLAGFIVAGLWIRHLCRPRIDRLSTDGLRLGEREIPLSDIESVRVISNGRSDLALTGGQTIKARHPGVIDADAMRALRGLSGGRINIEDMHAKEKRLALRGLGFGAAICVLVATTLAIAGVDVSGDVYARILLLPVLLIAAFGALFGVVEGMRRIDRWASRRKRRAKGQIVA